MEAKGTFRKAREAQGESTDNLTVETYSHINSACCEGMATWGALSAAMRSQRFEDLICLFFLQIFEGVQFVTAPPQKSAQKACTSRNKNQNRGKSHKAAFYYNHTEDKAHIICAQGFDVFANNFF